MKGPPGAIVYLNANRRDEIIEPCRMPCEDSFQLQSVTHRAACCRWSSSPQTSGFRCLHHERRYRPPRDHCQHIGGG